MTRLALRRLLPTLAAALMTAPEVERLDDAERLDYWLPRVALAATPVEVTAEGYEVYEGTATFGDVVLDYPEHGRAEFRPASEILSDEAIASMVGVPLTLGHPPRLLTAETARPYLRGAVLAAWREGNALRVRVVVHDAELAKAIRAGTVELSPGYRSRPRLAAGTFGGRPYQAIQEHVRFNHNAVVDRARAVTPEGDVARLDQESSTTMDMIEITLPDGTKAQVPKAVAALIESLRQELAAKAAAPTPAVDAAPRPPAPPTPPAAAPEAERADAAAELRTQLAELGARLDRMPDTIRREAATYGALRAEAEPILADAKVEHRFDGDPLADKLAVVRAVFGAEDSDVKTLDAALDAARKAGKPAPATEVARLDGLYKAATREHRSRRDKTGAQLQGLAQGARMDAAAKAQPAALHDLMPGFFGKPPAPRA